jgi:hypothetical protein
MVDYDALMIGHEVKNAVEVIGYWPSINGSVPCPAYRLAMQLEGQKICVE